MPAPLEQDPLAAGPGGGRQGGQDGGGGDQRACRAGAAGRVEGRLPESLAQRQFGAVGSGAGGGQQDPEPVAGAEVDRPADLAAGAAVPQDQLQRSGGGAVAGEFEAAGPDGDPFDVAGGGLDAELEASVGEVLEVEHPVVGGGQPVLAGHRTVPFVEDERFGGAVRAEQVGVPVLRLAGAASVGGERRVRQVDGDGPPGGGDRVGQDGGALAVAQSQDGAGRAGSGGGAVQPQSVGRRFGAGEEGAGAFQPEGEPAVGEVRLEADVVVDPAGGRVLAGAAPVGAEGAVLAAQPGGAGAGEEGGLDGPVAELPVVAGAEPARFDQGGEAGPVVVVVGPGGVVGDLGDPAGPGGQVDGGLVVAAVQGEPGPGGARAGGVAVVGAGVAGEFEAPGGPAGAQQAEGGVLVVPGQRSAGPGGGVREDEPGEDSHLPRTFLGRNREVTGKVS